MGFLKWFEIGTRTSANFCEFIDVLIIKSAVLNKTPQSIALPGRPICRPFHQFSKRRGFRHWFLRSVSYAVLKFQNSGVILNFSPRNSQIACTPALLNQSRQVWFWLGAVAEKAVQVRMAALGLWLGSRTEA